MSRVRHLFTRTPDIECLCESEVVQAEGMGERRRAQFLLGRTALRTLAGQVLGVAPRDVPLAISGSGAPHLSSGELHLSLSHSGDGALAAVADTPVGCDLEALHGRARDFTALAERFFPPSEAESIRSSPAEDQQILFLSFWTRKEAAFKCGVLDWPRCLRHPWLQGANALEAGSMALRAPEGLPEGWIGSLALWRPRTRPLQRDRMGSLADPPSHDRT